MQTKTFFFEDDGTVPNNSLPLILHRDAFEKRGSEGAAWLEDQFAKNNWLNSWRNGVFGYHHYHSTSHEVLGVYSGSAKLQLGGEQGEELEVKAGDVCIIPAGVAHKNLGSSNDFGVVGAYPNGRSHDLKTADKNVRTQSYQNIIDVPVPTTDPLLGKDGGLTEIWHED